MNLNNEVVAGLKEMNEEVDINDLFYITDAPLVNGIPETIMVTRVYGGQTFKLEYKLQGPENETKP